MRRAGIGVAVLAGAVAIAAAVSRQEAARRSMEQADRDFDRAVAAHDKDRFAGLVAEDAVFFSRRGPTRGRAKVVEAWTPMLTDGGPRLTWGPTESAVANSGDLGYTLGTYTLTSKDSDGGTQVGEGHYVTIWRRGDGGWQAAVDIGTPASPAAKR